MIEMPALSDETIREILKHYRWGIEAANQCLNINAMLEMKEENEKVAIDQFHKAQRELDIEYVETALKQAYVQGYTKAAKDELIEKEGWVNPYELSEWAQKNLCYGDLHKLIGWLQEREMNVVKCIGCGQELTEEHFATCKWMVCCCGHPKFYHDAPDGCTYCSPRGLRCPCEKFELRSSYKDFYNWCKEPRTKGR